VILWTRLTTGDLDVAEADVRVEVAEDPSFERIVTTSDHAASASHDWTVNTEVAGLQPGTTYYYRFQALDRTSTVGRTRTAPDGGVEHLRLAVVSCSNYAYGNFHAYRHLARRADIDAVVHLGDYIYEYADSGDEQESYGQFRTLEPRGECLVLDDYRQRYAQYRTEPGLKELHRQMPMIHLWDDHEFVNDPAAGGAENHQPTDGDYDERIAAALQANSEWMPTRLDGDVIYRTLDFGDLARLAIVDRQHRFLWPGEPGEDAPDAPVLDGEQRRWLDERVSSNEARWFVLGTGSTFGAIGPDQAAGGWGAEHREPVFTAAEDAGVENLVVLTGDIHKAQAFDLVRTPGVYDPATGDGTIGVELSSGSITSPGGVDLDIGPQFLYSQGLARTYLVLDLTPEAAQADWFGFEDSLKLEDAEPSEEWLAGFVTSAGANHLTQADEPKPTVPGPELAPEMS